MKKILVIDDEKLIGECLKEEFEFLGHKVTTISEPELATAVIKSQKFDIILLDIMMPKINGIELFDRIRPRTKAKIVFLSGISDMMCKESALEKADMILEKPFSLEDIKRIVDL